MRWPVWGTFDQPADLMLKTGGAWVRDDFAWSLIEPARDQFDWTATDRIVGKQYDESSQRHIDITYC